jgi:hypothetical protein
MENPGDFFMKIMNPDGLLIDKLVKEKNFSKVNVTEDIV